jgi:hypothetical protein
VLLLRAALQDASNVQFVMVSDTSIPLYPPQVRAGATAGDSRNRSMMQQAQQTAERQHDAAGRHMYHTEPCS